MGRDTATTRDSNKARFVYASALRHTISYNDDAPITAIFITTVLALFMLGLLAYMTKSVFFTDAIISIAIVSIVYSYRKYLLFSWEGTLLCCAGWLMNMLGTLGAYDIYFGSIGWDKLLHFTSMIGLTLLAYAYLERTGRFSHVETAVLAFFIAQGFGAINEIAEFIGTQYFGAGQGLFGMMNGLTEPPDKFAKFDTQWDMITNSIGIAIALVYASVKRKQVYKTKAASPEL